jgi:hypothetical protein
MVVRQTGGRDPLRGIQIPGVPAGGPQPSGAAPSAPALAPAPWTRVKGLQAVPPPQVTSGVGGREATSAASHRRVICFGPPRSVRGLLVGPRRPAPRSRAHRGALVRRHHHHRARRHRHRHHHRSHLHHRHPHHLGVISPRGSNNNNNNNNNNSNNNSGRPASRVAGKSRAPSKCSPLFHESNYHVERS